MQLFLTLGSSSPFALSNSPLQSLACSLIAAAPGTNCQTVHFGSQSWWSLNYLRFPNYVVPWNLQKVYKKGYVELVLQIVHFYRVEWGKETSKSGESNRKISSYFKGFFKLLISSSVSAIRLTSVAAFFAYLSIILGLPEESFDRRRGFILCMRPRKVGGVTPSPHSFSPLNLPHSPFVLYSFSSCKPVINCICVGTCNVQQRRQQLVHRLKLVWFAFGFGLLCALSGSVISLIESYCWQLTWAAMRPSHQAAGACSSNGSNGSMWLHPWLAMDNNFICCNTAWHMTQHVTSAYATTNCQRQVASIN